MGIPGTAQRGKRGVAVLTLASVLALMGPSHLARAGAPIPPQADAATDLATAEKFYADLDYDRANLVAARILALTDAALGHEDQARDEFVELLTYSADFQVDPNLGPRVTAPFLEARGYWRARPEKPGLEVQTTLHADGPSTLRITTRDPTHIIKKGTLGFRWGTSVPYTTQPLTVGEGVLVDVPERPANITRLDFYAQAFDEREDAVMEVGNPTSPKSVVVDLPKVVVAPVVAPSHSIFASPIFWTIAGVVVAGAATTTYFLTRPKAATGATLSGTALCGPGVPPMPCQ